MENTTSRIAVQFVFLPLFMLVYVYSKKDYSFRVFPWYNIISVVKNPRIVLSVNRFGVRNTDLIYLTNYLFNDAGSS
jgi:hypothetical protein